MGLLLAAASFRCLLDQYGWVRNPEIAVLGNYLGVRNVARPPDFARGTYPWGKYQLVAATWIFVAGTLWWYFLSLVMERAFHRLQYRRGHRDGNSVTRLDI